jgi:hypothetical protein
MSENEQGEREDFLARWSRRKSQARNGEPLPEPAEDTDEEPVGTAPAGDAPLTLDEDAAAGDTGADEEIELPPLESLHENSDYSAFLRDGVPDDVRQKALQKLFHSPKFNVRDGLDDYDWDFTNPEPLGDVITAEMRYRMRRELERLAGLDDDEETPQDSPAVVAAESGQPEAADTQADPESDSETDDERSEPS